MLFECDYLKFVRRAFPNRTDHAELVNKIFHSQLFADYDKDTVNTSELITRLCALLECPPQAIDDLLLALKLHLVPMPESVTLLAELKTMGIKSYGLTNMPKDIYDHLLREYEFLNMLEDITVSSYLGLAKPDPAIYAHLLAKNNLDPAKTVFIDDRPINLPPAAALGIKPFLFTSVTQLIADLKADVETLKTSTYLP